MAPDVPGYHSRTVSNALTGKVRSMISIRTTLAGSLLFAVFTVTAQTYPAKPIRLVVGWPTGGAADGGARPLALKLGEALGRPVVIENRPGATGTIGATVVAKAPADGYTLLYGTSNELVMNPYDKMPYRPVEDFSPISTVTAFPSVLVVHPSIPVKTLQQFVTFTRARAGKLNFATAGAGTTLLSGEMFKSLAKVDYAYIQYKGGGPAIIDLIGGHVDAMFATLPSAVTFIRNSKLRALMVTDSKRSPAAPEIPSAKEAGFGQMVLVTWNGVLAPQETPVAILERLNTAITAVMNIPEMRQQILHQAAEVTTSSREEFAGIIRRDLAKWTALSQLATSKARN